MANKISAVLEAVRSLKLGVATVDETASDTVFSIEMDHAPSATSHRLQRLQDRVEALGFRVLVATIRGATLSVSCRRSERTMGQVTRIARDANCSILTLLSNPPVKVWRISDHVVAQRHMLLLTQPGDDVTLWRDLDENGEPEPGTVSAFRNGSMPAMF